MRKMIKLAIGLAALGFVGLIGLSTISMLWAIAAPRPFLYVMPGEEVPARTVEVSSVNRGIIDTTGTSPAEVRPSVQTTWGKPAQIPVNVPESWIGVILLFGMPAIIFIVIRSMRRGRATAPSDESALVHELARRAQDLSQRMEALETILLDRTRTAR